MFPKNFWYVAAMSHEVQRRLLARTLLNEPVVIYRRENGTPAAIEDRCSHRRVSLSLGKLVGDHVQCGYHGVTFDGSGQCVRIPNQERIPPQACIKGYPAEERDGFVWIWMGDKALADADLIPDFSDLCSSGRYVGKRSDALRVAAPYLFNIENVLDLSHTTYAHEKTVGTKEVAETRPETVIGQDYVEVSREWERSAASPVFQRLFGWDVVKRSQCIRFWPGGNVRLDLTFEPVGNTDPAQVKHISVAGPCTPEADESHFKFSTMYRDFALDNDEITEKLAAQFHMTIMEDKVLMEDQCRNWLADGAEARMFDLSVDKAPIAARRMLHRLVAAERG